MGTLHLADFEKSLRESRKLGEPELKKALTRLAAEIEQRLKTGGARSGPYFERAALALEGIRGNGLISLRLRCMFKVSHYFQLSGASRQLLKSAANMLTLAESAQDSMAQRQALLLLGVAFVDEGHVGRAIECYARALPIAEAICDVGGQIGLWNNTSVALQTTSQFLEALSCARRAIDLAGVIPEYRALRAASLSNVAYCCLKLGYFRDGLDAAQRSVSESPIPSSAADLRSLATREQNLSFILLELGRVDEARESARRAYEYASRSGSDHATAQADMISGLCNVYQGNVDAGLKELLAAAGKTTNHAPLHIDALASLAKAYDLVGQPAMALDTLETLLRAVSAMRVSRLAIDSSLAELDMRLLGHVSRGGIADLMQLELQKSELRAKVAERNLELASIEIFERLAITADLKEETSGEHGYRVGKLAALLAAELGLGNSESEKLMVAARLHDIGKVGIPDRILLTSDELKEAERHLMSSHTIIGAELLAKSDIPQLRMAEEIARCHHEWWNGTGYPAKLSGKRIPLHARIVAIADVFDAITHGRPYEQPWPFERAIEQIRSLRGEQFDPEITDRFLVMIERLRREHSDLDEYLGRAGKNSPFLQARRRIREMLASDPPSPPTTPGSRTLH